MFVCFPGPHHYEPSPASGACHGVHSPLNTQSYVGMSCLLCCRPLPRCKFLAKFIAIVVPTIVRGDLMGSVIGHMAYLTALAGLTFVRQTYQHEPLFICRSISRFPPFSTAGCWAIWCPCVVFGETRQRFRSLQYQGRPLAGGGDVYNDYCCIYSVFCCIGYPGIVQVRCDVDEMR